jgi:uncharacterized protein YbgA (DUF1722 family)/uncharacterized protein YbbK (DUF523 family)
MAEFPRPRVVASRCLEFAACRYNGQRISCRFVRLLEPHVDFLPVCPEMEIGLGCPRNPVRVVEQAGRRRLVQQIEPRDVTGPVVAFCESHLASLADVDGFLLKSRSPSCGIKDVKIYPSLGKVASIGRGAGFFGGAVAERFGGLPIEDEGRLNDYRIREHFLTHLFFRTRLRLVAAGGAMGGLVDFHAANKLLILAHNQQALREMGRIVANHERRPFAEVVAEYAGTAGRVFGRLASARSCINVLQHAAGYFSRQLGGQEKRFFAGLLRRLLDRRVPLSVPLNVIHSWAVRFEQPYLLAQTLLEPFPEMLMDVTDSGKGRDLDA